jgi:hypothetical protein
MGKFGKKISKALFTTTYVLLLFFFLWQILLRPLIDEFIPLGPIYTDVAKRIKSPDGTKTALLIRRNAWHLGFEVKIKEGLKTKTLHWSRNFDPDLKADWNEKIVWSDDSSFIILTVDNVQNDNEKYMWAYDFRDGKEYRDKDTIFSIMNSRSKIPALMPSPH